MAVDGRLNFDTKIDTKGFSKGVSSLGSQLNGLKSTILKIGTSIGLAFGTKEIIESAAKINAASSQLTQTFGKLKPQAESAMDSVARNSGIVVTRLQEVGTSIYAFAKTAGMDSVTALNMMQEALQVTADQAAYYDRSLEDTAESLKSFLKGNFENDAALGISCTETTRNAAANKLYGKSFVELSEAQKQLTLLQMVKDANALSGAEGQAAREADGWENVIGNLKEAWKQLLAVVGQPVLSAAVTVVKNITAELQKLTAVANSAVKALAEVFGIELMNTTDAVADSSSTTADSYTEMADSAEKAAEANENSVADFDQVKKLGDSKSSSSSGAVTPSAGTLSGGKISTSVDVDTSDADKKLKDFFKRVKASFKTIFDPFKKAWEKNGAEVIDSMQYQLSGVQGLISEIGISFAEVWSNGTGERTIGHILGIFANINTTIGNIARNLKTAWTTDNLGTDIVQHAADIWNTILDHVEKITKKISDWSSTVDFQPLLKSFDDLELALQPFAETVGEGLEDFFDEVLLPLASWTIEDVIPTFLETLSEVIEGLTSAWNTAYPVVKEKLWDEFLKPIAKWTADKALTALSELGDIFKKICDNVTEKDVEILLDLAGAIGSVYAAVKGKKKLDDFNNALKTMKINAKNALTKVQQLWAAANVPLVTPKSTAIVPAGMGTQVGEAGTTAGLSFSAKFAAAVGSFFVGWNIGSMIRDAIGGDKIDEFLFPIFDEIVGFFTKKVPDFFSEFWSSLNEDILFPLYDTAVAAWNSIETLFTEKVPKFFSEFWSDLNEDILFPLYDTAVAAWNSIVKFFTETVPQDIEENIVIPMTESFKRAWEGIKEAWSNVKQWFSDRWDDITGVFASVGSWFGEKFTIAWGGIQSAFSNVKTWFGERWKDIKDVFSDIKKWFTDKFTGAWDGIKGVFSDVGEFFGGVWDDMTAGVKGAINTVIDGLNWMIDGINSISFEMPDWNWLPDDVQGATLGINIPEIPKLATGAVVPASYGEFMAILGDNKRETEVVSPLSTMKQALLEALVAYGGTGGNQKVSVTIPVSLNGRVISQLVIDDINDLIKRNGRSPIKA